MNVKYTFLLEAYMDKLAVARTGGSKPALKVLTPTKKAGKLTFHDTLKHKYLKTRRKFLSKGLSVALLLDCELIDEAAWEVTDRICTPDILYAQARNAKRLETLVDKVGLSDVLDWRCRYVSNNLLNTRTMREVLFNEGVHCDTLTDDLVYLVYTLYLKLKEGNTAISDLKLELNKVLSHYIL